MNKPSRTRLLVDRVIPGGLDQFVKLRREQKESWDSIARSIQTHTGAVITANTVRRWYPEPEKSQTPAA